MVEKVIKPGPNVVDFARYQADRAGKALAISARDFRSLARACRHCGAALLDGRRLLEPARHRDQGAAFAQEPAQGSCGLS